MRWSGLWTVECQTCLPPGKNLSLLLAHPLLLLLLRVFCPQTPSSTLGSSWARSRASSPSTRRRSSTAPMSPPCSSPSWTSSFSALCSVGSCVRETHTYTRSFFSCLSLVLLPDDAPVLFHSLSCAGAEIPRRSCRWMAAGWSSSRARRAARSLSPSLTFSLRVRLPLLPFFLKKINNDDRDAGHHRGRAREAVHVHLQVPSGAPGGGARGDGRSLGAQGAQEEGRNLR